jgi:hypothetical protein
MTGAAWLRTREDDVTRYIEASGIQAGRLEHLSPPVKGGDTDV